VATRPGSARLVGTKEEPLPGGAPIALALLCVSLAVLFVSSLAGYAYLRVFAPAWPPPGSPPLPRALWVSTGLLVLTSAAVHGALVAARRGRPDRVRAAVVATDALVLGFLLSQGLCWATLLERLPPGRDQYAFTFYLLTGLHAAHVLGGLPPLAVVTVRALRGRYGPDETLGLRLAGMYWHFLDGVWMVLFTVLYLVG
jgi:cytochrome c oxidase subunit 3